MASTVRSCIAGALNDLSDDGISFPSADNDNLQVLIYDYFNESATDDSRSDDDECSKEFLDFHSKFMCTIQILLLSVTLKRTLQRTLKRIQKKLKVNYHTHKS